MPLPSPDRQKPFFPQRAPRTRLPVRAMTAALAALTLLQTPTGARAGEAADLTRTTIEAGKLADGEKALSARLAASASDDEARFGLAMVRFAAAIQTFGQHHYRHGLRAPAIPMFPFLRMPVPENPNPEVLTYEAQRAAFAKFLADLMRVEGTLAPIKDRNVKIPLDLETVHLDFRDTGTSDPAATLMNVVRSINGARPMPPKPDARFEAAFDYADAIWLRGYCHLLAAGLEFVLAYDWSPTFAAGGELFYPRIGTTAGAAARPSTTAGTESLPWVRGGGMGDIASAVAMIHLIRWEPVEPKRMSAARQHLKEVVRLSRDNWAAILAETDDDREWLPSPAQKSGVLPNMGITDDRVKTWFSALDEFDAVLDGRKLVPHWGLEKGINLKRVFEEPRMFDLVLWATGHGVAPYLENGPMISAQTWAMWQRVFQGNFLGFAAYFN